MTDTQNVPQIGEPETGRQFGVALIAGLIVVLILAGGAYFWIQKTSSKPVAEAPPLPMGAAEQAYASQIEFGSFDLSRASNFLNQQVTYVNGVVSNRGQRDVVEMEVSLEFRDVAQNVILRDKQRMFGSKERPLQSLEKRAFQLNFENIPDGWNQTPPTFIITGLRLQ
jgi:hypothetical protein